MAKRKVIHVVFKKNEGRWLLRGGTGAIAEEERISGTVRGARGDDDRFALPRVPGLYVPSSTRCFKRPRASSHCREIRSR